MAKRHNIGLLVATITDVFSNRITAGAMEAAKQLDANLVIFPGKYVGLQRQYEEYDTKYEYQYNVLFDHAAGAKLDYLIVAVGTIAYAYDNARKKEFLDRLGDTPILSVASEIEGYDFLQFNNSSGVTAAVDHLATHGRKHIGIMAGVLENQDCLQRFEAYKKALEANGLEFNDKYVTECSLFEECRSEAERFIDSNPELDAIICINDVVASVVCEALKERDIQIGCDVAVVGFDDIPLAAKLDPPLASVRADAVLLGKRAVEKAVNYLNGVKDEEHYVDSRFILRQSCFEYTGDPDIIDDSFMDGLFAMIDKIRDHLLRSYDNTAVIEGTHSLLLGLIEHLDKNYISELATEKTVKETISILNEITHRSEGPYGILYDIYIRLLRHCRSENVQHVKTLHSYFIGDSNKEIIESVTNKFTERSHLDNIFVRDALMFGGNLRDSYANIMKRLADVNAMTGFIYILDPPITHRYGDSFPKAPNWNFKSYSYGSNVFTVPETEQRVSAAQVFDNKYLCAERQHTFVVADLYTAETQYGIALLEPGDVEFFEDLELVTYQLSSAVRTLDILRNQERLLEEINTRNLALDRMSKIDELTKVYNRRGFYPAAEALINATQNQGRPFIICYADLDDLKTVNDNYGHAEGDFSIKLVAECLAHTFGDDAVIGRMGGDEFAAIVPASAEITAEALAARKTQFVADFNTSGGKPYDFGVSMGVLEYKCDNSYDLRAAIDKADDLLYIEKSKKKKKL